MKNFSIFMLIMIGMVITNECNANVQSTIYTDDIGRSHFLGRGGYSTVRQMNMQGIEANVVNDAVNTYSQQKKNVENVKEELTQETKEVLDAVETTNITDVIKERQVVPVSTHSKSTFVPETRKLDASAPFGAGMTNVNSGVNESKTIYTDELGRLHFFGRANQIRE